MKFPYITLASNIQSLLEDWERQDRELEHARAYLEPEDRTNEAAENERINQIRETQIAAIIHREMETERGELVGALKKCEAELQKNTRYFHSFGQPHFSTAADSIDGVISIARAVLAKYEQENHER